MIVNSGVDNDFVYCIWQAFFLIDIQEGEGLVLAYGFDTACSF